MRAPLLRLTCALVSLAVCTSQALPLAVAGGRFIRSPNNPAVYWQPEWPGRNDTKYHLTSCTLCANAPNLCVVMVSNVPDFCACARERCRSLSSCDLPRPTLNPPPAAPAFPADIDRLFNSTRSFDCSWLPPQLTGYQPGAPAPRLGLDARNSGNTPGVSFPLTGAGATLAWSYQTGALISATPAIDAGGAVYIGSTDGWLYAFNASTVAPGAVSGAAQLLWRFNAGGPIRTTPSIGNNRYLYFGSSAGVFALNLSSTPLLARAPQLAWSFNDSGAIGAVVSSIAIDPSTNTYVGLGTTTGQCYFGSQNGFLYGLDCRTGYRRWRTSTRLGGGANATGVSSSPLVFNGMVIIGAESGYVLACNSSNGTVVWSFLTGSQITASPVLDASGFIYIGAWNGQVYKLNAMGGRLAWQYNTNGIQIENMGAVTSSAYFFGSNACAFYQLLPATGALTRLLAVGQPGWFNNPPVVDANGVVFSGMGAAACRVNAWNASSGAAVFNVTISMAITNAGVALSAGGMFFFGSAGGVFHAYAPASPSASPSPTASGTASGTLTPPGTPAGTGSGTAAATASVTSGASASGTGSRTVTATLTATTTASGTANATASASAAATATASVSTAATLSPSGSASFASPDATPSLSFFASASPSASATLSRGASSSASLTADASPSAAPAGTAGSPAPASSASPSTSLGASAAASASLSPGASASAIASATAAITPTPTASPPSAASSSRRACPAATSSPSPRTARSGTSPCG